MGTREQSAAGAAPGPSPGSVEDPLVIAGRELRSRLLLGTGGFPSLELLGRGGRAERQRAGHRGAAARAGRTSAARCWPCSEARGRPGAAQHGRLPHRARRGADRADGARGVRDRLGQARGDRRRGHAAARRAGAAAGGRAARRRRLRGAPLHDRRPRARAAAGRHRLRRGDAARLADRQRHGDPQPVQHRADPRSGRGAGGAGRRASAPPPTRRSRWSSAATR